MFLSVIIPAYNEEKRIGKTLDTVFAYLLKQPYESEVLVVDDGSEDTTKKIVENFRPLHKNLKILEYGENRGKGFAVNFGMLRATGEVRIFMDADGSTSIEELSKILQQIILGKDVVVSSRRMQGSKLLIKQNFFRDFLGAIFRWLVRFTFPISVSDSQNGFKGFTKEAVEKIFPRQRIFGWAFDVEILVIASKLNLRVAEVPIEWCDDRESKVRFLGMIKMLLSLLQIKWNLFRGLYSM